MGNLIKWFEDTFTLIPLPVLEVWGRFGFLVGLILMWFAYGGFTLRSSGKWKLGVSRQTWDSGSLQSFSITFILNCVTGYLGSFFILVPEIIKRHGGKIEINSELNLLTEITLFLPYSGKGAV